MNRSNVKKFTKILLKAVMFTSIILVGIGLYQSYSNKKSQEKMKALVEMARVEDMDVIGEVDMEATKHTKEPKLSEENGVFEKVWEKESPSQILPEYEQLYELNQELIGWLTIEGTVIDYPVMKGQDNEYYLNHNFEGNESKYGCLFVKNFVDVSEPGTNFIIYGHHMKDGSMFGELKKYKKEEFFKEHPYVVFHSLYEKRMYEIIAVFQSEVYAKEYEGFKYYEFYQADTEEEFLYFYNNIKELSIFDTGIKAVYGDRFITLSTCDYHTSNGRLVIVAKEI